MTTQLQMNRSFQIGGMAHNENRNITLNGTVNVETPAAIGPAKTGLLTVRTDANTGSLTMQASHGITDGQLLDVYWSGGCRRGMTVGTVVALVVPIDGGSGDDLPAASTAITAMVPVIYDMHLIGDDLLIVVASSPVKAIFSIQETDGTERAAFIVPIANTNGATASWLEEDGATNPLATRETEKVAVSHGDSATARTLRISAGY